MPSTLRRSRRRELVLTSSFTRAIQDKVRLEPCVYWPSCIRVFLISTRPRTDGKECRTFFADRTNGHALTPLTSTFETPVAPLLTSRPSMTLSLYPSLNPHQPIHSIHRLPPELLVHVFALGSVDNMMFPVLVSHVCHSWRAIVSHAHSLWRRVSLNPDSNVHMWKERVRRARLCTLDVVLASYPHPRAQYDIDLVALQMHLLGPHFSALRSLDIQFNAYAPYLWNAALGPFCRSPSYLWEYRSPNPGDRCFNGVVEVPKLESLTLRYPQNDDMKEFSLFGGFAPKLTRVTLEGVRLAWLPELFGNLSFLDYTHHGFSRGEETVDEVLAMLQVSSRIRELKLCICHKTTTFQALNLRRLRISDDNVALPSLRSLSLRVGNEDSDIPSELITIISRLFVPELKSLNLQDRATIAFGSQHGSSTPFATLSTFIDTIRHNASLRNLMLEGRWFQPSLVSSLAALLPSLKTIRVDNMVIPMGLVSEM